MKIILRILSAYKQYPWLVCAQLFCAVLMTVMLPVFPEISGRIYQEVISQYSDDLQLAALADKIEAESGPEAAAAVRAQQRNLSDPQHKEESQRKVIFYTLIAFGAFFIRDIFNWLRIVINGYFEQNTIYDRRSELYAKLQRLPLKWFDSRRTGDILMRIGDDVPAMNSLLIGGAEVGLISTLQIIGISTFLIWKDPILGLTALVPIPMLLISATIFTRYAEQPHRDIKECAGEVNSLLADNIAGISQIKSYAAEPEELERYDKISDKLRSIAFKIMHAWAIYSPTVSFVNAIGYTLVLGVGGWRIISDPSIGTEIYLYFFTIMWALYEPILALHGLNTMVLSAQAAGERVYEILDTPDEPHMDEGEELAQPVRGGVVFDNVSFSYDEIPTLNNISLKAEPGQTIALVGTTGAGKSTLVKLLSRFYEYQDGSITIDGQEVNTLNKVSLRSNIAYVTQESFLFNGSVRENLVLGKRDATDEELWRALDAANATPFVKELPEQLDTNVGERGVKVSGGEKQRLSIARALLKNQPILILDEATASVDSKTERLIQSALDNLMETRTAFVIAHRLSTIENADVIHVLDQGHIIESGSHEELIALGGRYAALSQQAMLT